MSNPFSDALTLTLKPSRYLAGFIIGLHSLVIVITLLTPAFPFIARLAMAGIVGLSLWRSMRLQYWHKDKNSITQITWQADQSWLISTPEYQDLSVQLASSSFVSRKAWVLNFQHEEYGRFNAIILPDSIDSKAAQAFRMRWFSAK